ncbi:hypothetical protein KW882_02350 [Vibrio parahaemolyticus]
MVFTHKNKSLKYWFIEGVIVDTVKFTKTALVPPKRHQSNLVALIDFREVCDVWVKLKCGTIVDFQIFSDDVMLWKGQNVKLVYISPENEKMGILSAIVSFNPDKYWIVSDARKLNDEFNIERGYNKPLFICVSFLLIISLMYNICNISPLTGGKIMGYSEASLLFLFAAFLAQVIVAELKIKWFCKKLNSYISMVSRKELK